MMIDKITLQIKTFSALHIGAQVDGEHVSDSPFRRRADGRIVIPGTSIAGAIRSHLTRITPAMTGLKDEGHRIICDALTDNHGEEDDKPCGCIVCHLMGDLYPGERVQDVKAYETRRASRLIVHDALFKDESLNTVTVDRVGIDRTTRAASRREQSKYDIETVPAGAQFEIILELEDADDIDRYLVSLAVDELRAGRIRLGGHTGQGMGWLEVQHKTRQRYDLREETGKHLMSYLRRQPSPEQYTDLWQGGRRYHDYYEPSERTVQSWLSVSFVLHVDGFFLADDISEAAAQGFDHLSRTYYPGASLRGVIRSHAERIARTITNLSVSDEQTFLATCPAAHPLSREINNGEEMVWLESGASRFGRKFGSVPMPYHYLDLSERLFGNTYWGSRLTVDHAWLRSEPIWKPLDFVAIDRFTGGAGDQLKFDALALWEPVFGGRLYLESPKGWEIGWLLYIIRDMVDGLVPIGFGAAKGFGHVTMQNVCFNLGYTYDDIWWEQWDIDTLREPQIVDSYFNETSLMWDELPDAWKEAWASAWINEVRNFKVADDIPHTSGSDPYWSTERKRLYTKEGK